MNKENFNALFRLERVRYFNRELAEGKSLKEIAKQVGLNKTAIRNNFAKLGYSYDVEARQYVEVKQEERNTRKELTDTSVGVISGEDFKNPVIKNLLERLEALEKRVAILEGTEILDEVEVDEIVEKTEKIEEA